MPNDLVNNMTEVTSLASIARTADANGTSADLQGYRKALFVAHVGANASIATDSLSSSIKVEFEIEESDNDSDYTDVASGDIIFDGTEPTGTNDGAFAVVDSDTETSTSYKAMYIGDSRYVRAVVNFTGTPSIPCSVVIHRIEPTHAPV